MIYNVQILVEVDAANNHIPADESEEFLTDLVKDLIYDADDVKLLAIAIDNVRKDNV